MRTMERSFVRVRLCLQSHSVQMPNAGDLRATVDDMTMRRVEGGRLRPRCKSDQGRMNRRIGQFRPRARSGRHAS